MKTTHSFSIDFIIRRCKENKQQALIYARITVDEERKEISIKERINAASAEIDLPYYPPAADVQKVPPGRPSPSVLSRPPNPEPRYYHFLSPFARSPS
ncbi:MAG TPA: hypothetical protein VG605_10920 [Puia sp.]|nr:hypothetical protein [Puia sp.]